ncbi:MAG: PAS domain S-box protein [Spirochaetaceae bacterium]|nr:MAG: PAS domain S-box protein [Spirochaetaceae bacterium]
MGRKMNQLENADLEKQSRDILGHLYDVAGVGMCVTGADRSFVAVNREYCETYGYAPSELLGNEFTMVLPSEQREAAAQLHDDFLLRGQGEVSGEWVVGGKDGALRTVLITAGRLELEYTVYKITTVYDMRGRSTRANLDQMQENTLREVNHRVKNHLNSLQSMLYLQLLESEGETKIVSILTDSINRIKSMSRLYDSLQNASSVTSIGLKAYLDSLIADIVSTGGREDLVEVSLDVEDLKLTVEQGVSLGLILNELATNSLKHAIPQGGSGSISISVHSTGPYIEARISDSGPGVSADYLDQTRESIGMQIISAIVGQHAGDFFLEDPERSQFVVRLPRVMD